MLRQLTTTQRSATPFENRSPCLLVAFRHRLPSKGNNWQHRCEDFMLNAINITTNRRRNPIDNQ